MSATTELIGANIRNHARHYVAAFLAIAICTAFIASCFSFSGGMGIEADAATSGAFTTASILLIAAALVVVGLTFKVTFAGRRSEVALLRAIGARPGQLRFLMIAEAALVAAAAAGFGIVAGVFGGAFAVAQLGAADSLMPVLSAQALANLGLVWAASVGATVLLGLGPAIAAASPRRATPLPTH